MVTLAGSASQVLVLPHPSAANLCQTSLVMGTSSHPSTSLAFLCEGVSCN